MPARRVRSGTILAGAALSALAHAALIALALVAPPWLRPHRERPAPVVVVALIAPAAFEAAIARLTAPDPPPPAARSAPPSAVPSVAPPPATAIAPSAVAPEIPEPPELPTLAPAFDADAPLGLGPKPVAEDLPAHRPHARPGGPLPEAAPPVDPARAAATFAEAVRTAVTRQVGERGPGPAGTVRLGLIINREGRLLWARMLKSSGSDSLDRLATEAARTARLPEMPETMPHVRTTVEIDLVFAATGNGDGG